MNKKFSLALVALFALSGITASAQTTEATSIVPTSIGGDRDVHGCIPSAGYSWNETKKACTRAWEDRAEANTGAIALPPKPPMIAPGMQPAPMKAPLMQQMKGIRPEANTMRATTTTMPKNIREENMVNREEMERRAKEMRASSTVAREAMKDEMMKKRIEIARKQTELVTKRLEAAIERIQKLSDRVSERLTKFEAEGVNVTVSRGHIEEATSALDDARTKLSAVKLSVESVFTATSTPNDALKGLQGVVREATKAVQIAQRNVAEAISSVKPGFNKPRPATTPAVEEVSTTTATTTE